MYSSGYKLVIGAVLKRSSNCFLSAFIVNGISLGNKEKEIKYISSKTQNNDYKIY